MVEGAKTVGLLYPGEMGASVAAFLTARGIRVVTHLLGRGEQTASRCRTASIELLDSFSHVVMASGIVISLVPPSAAEALAETYCKYAQSAPRGAIFVDANSIGPDSVAALATRMASAGVDFVDAAINGLAKNFVAGGTLFLSGTRAREIAVLFGDGIRVRVLGDQPGRASAMKMLLSGLSKGLCALFVETALVAEKNGMLAEMGEAYSEIYPGVMAIVNRMLPTYSQHAGRRAEEMRELELTALRAGINTPILSSIRQVHELLATMDFGSPEAAIKDVPTFVQKLVSDGLFAMKTDKNSPGKS